jgi:hypothetical protein
MPVTDAHGGVIRSDRFPLDVGDEFTLHACQAKGVSGNFCGYILPGRYAITQELSPTEVIIRRLDHESATEWSVGRDDLLAILGDWSHYSEVADSEWTEGVESACGECGEIGFPLAGDLADGTRTLGCSHCGSPYIDEEHVNA